MRTSTHPPTTRSSAPPPTGAYQLVLRLRRSQRIRIGARLGERRFPAGYYVYTGSALGSGGLAARLRHHLDRTKVRHHWHIDYLTTHPGVEIVAVHRRPATRREECRLNRATEGLPGAAVPVPGFGKSDARRHPECRCAAHLVHFRRRPGALPAARGGEGASP